MRFAPVPLAGGFPGQNSASRRSEETQQETTSPSPEPTSGRAFSNSSRLVARNASDSRRGEWPRCSKRHRPSPEPEA